MPQPEIAVGRTVMELKLKQEALRHYEVVDEPAFSFETTYRKGPATMSC